MQYFVCLLAWLASSCALAAQPVYVGFDGAYGLLNSTSAQAIEMGLQLAIDEVNSAGGVLNGRPLALLTKDNRSVPARGVANLKQFASNPDLVAMVGGRFSPVLLEQVPVTHELPMIMLDAWGSADGITEHDYQPSYTFRLSLRDALAAPAMLQHALNKQAQKVGLLLPNTAWGRSNLKAAQTYAHNHPQIHLVSPSWYNWGEQDMLQYYQQLRAKGAEAILLVANDIEGSLLVRQLADIPKQHWIPIIAHWGITGGEFVQKCQDTLFELDFSVVQTFSFFNTDTDISKRVLARLATQYKRPTIASIESPVGLAQAYDLLHILARAINLAGSTDRPKIRAALEQVRDYQGLTGNYPQPFTAESHDAMRQEHVFMAHYRRDGAIVPLSSP